MIILFKGAGITGFQWHLDPGWPFNTLKNYIMLYMSFYSLFFYPIFHTLYFLSYTASQKLEIKIFSILFDNLNTPVTSSQD